MECSLAQSPANFMERDTNGDGRLSLAESQLSEAQFQSFDTSENGELSLGEFNEYWQTFSADSVTTNLSYGEESSRQVLDLYLPSNLSSEMPLVVWIHGGSWKRGSKDANPFRTLTSHGYVVGALNYRFVQEAPFPAQINDVEQATKWLVRRLASEHQIKVTKVSAIGLSAGGHLSNLLSCKGAVDQAVSFGAPADLSQAAAVEAYRPTLEELIGGPAEENAEALKSASPYHQVSSQSGEFLIFHGTGDRRVPYREALSLAKAVASQDGFVAVQILPNGSHSLVGGPSGWKQILNFLSRP